MKIFISCSGKRSQFIASTLHRWLEDLFPSEVEPFRSVENISPGEDWKATLDKHLNEATFGILCLTQENVSRPWVLYEAGALTSSGSRLVPYCYQLNPSELTEPLASHQAVVVDEGGSRLLVRSINELLDRKRSVQDIDSLFDTNWPLLESQIANVPDLAPEKDANKFISDNIGQKKVVTIFEVTTSETAQSAEVLGNFTRWEDDPIPMQEFRKGLFFAAVALDRNQEHLFKFKVDGKWKDVMNDSYPIHVHAVGNNRYENYVIRV